MKFDLRGNGRDAYTLFFEAEYDLCILDIMLPEKDGFTLAEEIRKTDTDVPILFLTAKSQPEDKIRGFEIGADDYIIKPFSIQELIYRIKVFLRRSGKANDSALTFRLSYSVLDYQNLTLKAKDEIFELTFKEATLLREFMRRPNLVIKREELLMAVWGDDDYFLGRSLDVFISKLRKYLKGDDRNKYHKPAWDRIHAER